MQSIKIVYLILFTRNTMRQGHVRAPFDPALSRP